MIHIHIIYQSAPFGNRFPRVSPMEEEKTRTNSAVPAYPVPKGLLQKITERMFKSENRSQYYGCAERSLKERKE